MSYISNTDEPSNYDTVPVTEITPVSWLCANLDRCQDKFKVVFQDDDTVRVLIKETGEVWEFKAEMIRSAAR